MSRDFRVRAASRPRKTFNTEDTEKTENAENTESRSHELQVTNHGTPWAAQFTHFVNSSTTPSRAGQNFAERCAARIRNISTVYFVACAPTHRRPPIKPVTIRWKPSCSRSRSITKNGWTRSNTLQHRRKRLRTLLLR